MKPTPYHAALIIFLEFCSWGMITNVMLNTIKVKFGSDSFYYNGMVQGLKGILTFASVPIIGNLSDKYGRKLLLFLSVFFTCLPILFLLINYTAFFVILVISGVFYASFPLTFAYVSDCCTEKYKYFFYGLVSASFAASLIVSPVLGDWVQSKSSDTVVILLAVLLTLVNLLFIHYCTPESLAATTLPPTDEPSSLSYSELLGLLNPFKPINILFKSKFLRILSLILFLSVISECGQMTSIFIYLKSVEGFTSRQISLFIGMFGILSVIAQVLLLNVFLYLLGPFRTLYLALVLQASQLVIFGLFKNVYMLYVAGVCAAVSSVFFPCISCMASEKSSSDQKGLIQSLMTAIRSMCNGFGPALFGVLFKLAKISLDEGDNSKEIVADPTHPTEKHFYVFSPPPGIPYLIGSLIVVMAIVILHYNRKAIASINKN